MTYSIFSTINSLEPMGMIGGTEYTIEFNVYDNNNSPLELAGKTCLWTICQYGQPEYAILTKTGVISPTVSNRFTITLVSSDTENLSGKFTQQPIVVDLLGAEFRPAQGDVLIQPRIINV